MRPTSRHSKSLSPAIWLAAGATAGLVVGVALADRSRAARAFGHRLRGVLTSLGGLTAAAERTMSATDRHVEDEAVTVAVDDVDFADDREDADHLDELDDLDDVVDGFAGPGRPRGPLAIRSREERNGRKSSHRRATGQQADRAEDQRHGREARKRRPRAGLRQQHHGHSIPPVPD